MGIPPEYDFNQLVTEAVIRIGIPKVEAYLMTAAEKVGWPIPPADRYRVGAGLALLVQGIENPITDQQD
jgi:hypothetical protein